MDIGEHMREAVNHAQAGRLADAVRQLDSAIREHPASAQAHGMMGTLLHSSGRVREGIGHMQRAVELAPGMAPIAFQLGAMLVASGEPLRGLPYMQKAVDIDGKWMPGLQGLARALMSVGDFDRAESVLRRALEVDPKNAEAMTGLAGMFMVSGRQREAVELFRRAGSEHPGDMSVQGKLLSALNYAGDATPEESLAAHKSWGDLAVVGGEPRPLFENSLERDRKLKVGFLSTDLWDHSVAYFLRPILKQHNRDRLEVVCHSTVARADWMTEQLRDAADGWRDVSQLNETKLVDLIRADGVDVLFELSGHTGQGPLGALRRRAAPVQVAYLGYPNTTGLQTVDWRIVDGVTDPAGAEAWHTEKLSRLDRCFLCYSEPDGAPAVTESPGIPHAWAAWGAQSSGPRTEGITFGSFNSIRKIGPEVIEVWAEVLLAVPGSRMLIKTRGIGTPAARRSILGQFEDRGVAPVRVQTQELVETKSEHLGWYGKVDIGLDTFPYNGTTTTCEALWMGVPVVTLAGRVHAGRVGASILGSLGLRELVADSPRRFVEIAAGLAADHARLVSLRAGMRERMRNSRLMDAADMAAQFEKAVRAIWQEWCASA
jgi:predicted O-linked N-acetylglucosamine transferase (SPINDLY family)